MNGMEAITKRAGKDSYTTKKSGKAKRARTVN